MRCSSELLRCVVRSCFFRCRPHWLATLHQALTHRLSDRSRRPAFVARPAVLNAATAQNATRLAGITEIPWSKPIHRAALGIGNASDSLEEVHWPGKIRLLRHRQREDHADSVSRNGWHLFFHHGESGGGCELQPAREQLHEKWRHACCLLRRRACPMQKDWDLYRPLFRQSLFGGQQEIGCRCWIMNFVHPARHRVKTNVEDDRTYARDNSNGCSRIRSNVEKNDTAS